VHDLLVEPGVQAQLPEPLLEVVDPSLHCVPVPAEPVGDLRDALALAQRLAQTSVLRPQALYGPAYVQLQADPSVVGGCLSRVGRGLEPFVPLATTQTADSPLIRESFEVYQQNAKRNLTSHQLADYRRCPLLYRKKKLGLIEEEDRPAFFGVCRLPVAIPKKS